MHKIFIEKAENNSHCAGFQYLNSTNVSKRTNVFRYVQSIKLQKASIISLSYVSYIFIIFFNLINCDSTNETIIFPNIKNSVEYKSG